MHAWFGGLAMLGLGAKHTKTHVCNVLSRLLCRAVIRQIAPHNHTNAEAHIMLTLTQTHTHTHARRQPCDCTNVHTHVWDNHAHSGHKHTTLDYVAPYALFEAVDQKFRAVIRVICMCSTHI